MSSAVYGCRCLNVRLHVESTAETQTSLENIANVLECRLAGTAPAIEVALSSLVEVKPGSSVDRSINVVRCLLCKSPVMYFRASQGGSGMLMRAGSMPEPHSEGYIASEAKNSDEVLQIQKRPEYSEPFGVLLLPEYRSKQPQSRSRLGGAHVSRELQQRATEFLQRQEVAKNERVREYIHAQDRELELLQSRTMDECAMVAEIINAANPQKITSAPSAARRETGGSSGLAAMLRGGGTPASSIGRSNPLERSSSFDDNSDDEDVGGVFGLVDAMGGMSTNASGSGRRMSTQNSDEFSDDNDEAAFGNFEQMPAQAFPSTVGGMHQQPSRGGGLGQMLAGSMPIQIPKFGGSVGGVGSMLGGHSLSRDMAMRAEDAEQGRRRERFARELPKTFVPPHKLLDKMYENDTDLVIGSKPRDSYGLGRRYAPG